MNIPIKKILLTFVLFSSPLFALKVDLDAQCAILINGETGQVLFEKNASEKVYPASTTKVATAVYGLEKNRDFLDHEVIAEQDSIGTLTPEERRRNNFAAPSYRMMVGGTHIGIKKGEKLPLRALFYGLMLSSGNDAANVIAQYTSGKIPQFSKELNEYLKEIGCKNTHFNNPHGLHHPDHMTTAYDLAMMAKQGLKNPLFREVVSTVRYTRPKTNMQEATIMIQENRLLREGPHKYPYAIGVKTGFTNDAGHNLVAAAEKEGRTLVAVVMGCKEKKQIFSNVISLFNAAYNERLTEIKVADHGLQPYKISVKDVSSPVETFLTTPLTVKYYPSEEPKIKAWVNSEEKHLPIAKGDKLGTLTFKDQYDRVLATAPLLAPYDIKGSIFYRMRGFYVDQTLFLRTVVLLAILTICFFLGRRVIMKRAK